MASLIYQIEIDVVAVDKEFKPKTRTIDYYLLVLITASHIKKDAK
jgi:hypothetical protein